MGTFTPDHVQAALDGLNLGIRVLLFEQSTATAPEAAAAVGCELGQIIKSLCFVVGEQPVVVLAAGDRRVDDRKLGALYGVGRKKVKIADPDKTVAVTGYAPGGVSPVGHRTQLPIIIDDSLRRYYMVYAAAGSSNAIFPISFDKLAQATGGQVADVARDDGA
jgi:Cys-tRNA(Pro) deacylase